MSFEGNMVSEVLTLSSMADILILKEIIGSAQILKIYDFEFV